MFDMCTAQGELLDVIITRSYHSFPSLMYWTDYGLIICCDSCTGACSLNF